MRLRILLVCLFLAISPLARAGCGSSSCPLDLRALTEPARGAVTLDVSYQSIDQDQPRLGTRSAEVGEIPGAHHDEVRTLNRLATALLTWTPADRLSFSIAVPYVSRDHRHLGSSHDHARSGIASEHNVVPMSWQLSGLGDVTLEGRVALASFNPATRSRLWAIGGVKLPTGDHDRRNDAGQLGELPIQPGTGTTDGLVGLSYQSGIVRATGIHAAAGNFALVPYFVTATYQFRTGETDGYRLGNEWQVNAGTAYPLRRNVEVLLQLNSRFRAKDDIAEHEPADDDHLPEAAFTGGTFVYASPGVRVHVREKAAVYALVQLPVYQKVNALQLTSNANFVVGVQTRF